MSYFLLTNASNDLIVGKKRFTFTKVQFFHPTNSWWGVLESDDKDLAADKRVSEISADDYNKLLSRRGNDLVVEFAAADPLPSAPVVPVAATEIRATTADILTPKKVSK